mgnify:FL=1
MWSWPAFAGQLLGDDWSALEGADVVVFGEVHDNPNHHRNQANAVAALGPAALVFEQITPDLAARISPDLIADPARLEAVLEWEDRGWPDFAMYYPIFAAARDAAYFGGGASSQDVRRAVDEGAARAFGDGAELFGLEQALSDDEQSERQTIQHEAHCGALPAEMLPGMVQAQRLRDASLARAALAAHYEAVLRGTGPVVVITGNGHAGNRWGVPSLLRMQEPDLTVVSIAQFEPQTPDAPEFDHWLVTDAVERDDPCAVFRK